MQNYKLAGHYPGLHLALATKAMVAAMLLLALLGCASKAVVHCYDRGNGGPRACPERSVSCYFLPGVTYRSLVM